MQKQRYKTGGGRTPEGEAAWGEAAYEEGLPSGLRGGTRLWMAIAS